MAASYPTSVKSFTTKVNGVDAPDAEHINDLQLEVSAVETELLSGFTDYYASSTVVGWSSLTTTVLRYKKIGKLAVVQFRLIGTSNNIATSFSLPFSAALITYAPIIIMDNGGTLAFGSILISTNGSVVTCYKDAAGGGWTASGEKRVQGQFFVITN